MGSQRGRATDDMTFGNLSAAAPVQRAAANVSGDDLQLIAECLGGNTAAFGELVRRYQDRVYATVYRMVGNTEDAQDAVQEAFLHAYQSLESFKGGSQFFTWLYRIAVNTAISQRRKRRVLLRIDPGKEGAGENEPLDASEQSRPSHSLEQEEQARQVRQALDRLSPEHRAVLVLKEMEGHRYESMARILGVPVGTVRSRLHRARLELRQVLEQAEKE
jgi:RNA polymerase sigma-70 factor (ECF subfamily)